MSLVIVLALAVSFPTAPADTSCQVLKPDRVPVQGRKSPLDSLTFTVAKQPVKLCYGRPSARGRTMIGGEAVPYGKLWRTGANEPTIFFTPMALTVAGIRVPAGKYSLYTVPGEQQWEIIVNRSTSQWGEEHNYTDQVKAQEVGRGKVSAESSGTPVETFTIKADPATGDAKAIVLEWEKTRVRVPVSAGS
jgi:Protein of unknown function (DUF2911)